MDEGGLGVFEKLQAWSASFAKIKVERFGELLAPRESDLTAFARLAREAKQLAARATTKDQLEKCDKLVSASEALLQAARRYGADSSEGFKELAREVGSVQQQLTSDETKQRVAVAEREYDRLCKLFEANLPAGHRSAAGASVKDEDLRGKTLSFGGSGSGASSVTALYALVKALSQEVVRLARRVLGDGRRHR